MRNPPSHFADTLSLAALRSLASRIGRRGYVIIGVGTVVFASYAVPCIHKSVQLNDMMSPLRDKFIEEAEKAPVAIVTDDPDYRALDYQGRLDAIINIRNRILSENFGFTLGPWRSYVGFLGPGVKTTPIFCYNPFHKLDAEAIELKINRFLRKPIVVTNSAA